MGAIVNLVTKSGTNGWHGPVYEYFRNDALDANNFSNNANGLPRTVLRQNQYGVSLGGPLRRNNHFIFGNWEGNRVRQGTGPFASNVPAAAQRAGTLNDTSFTDANGRFDAGEPTAPAALNLAAAVWQRRAQHAARRRLCLFRFRAAAQFPARAARRGGRARIPRRGLQCVEPDELHLPGEQLGRFVSNATAPRIVQFVAKIKF
jgi:hypothetical protein